jgi:hypothetical protein
VFNDRAAKRIGRAVDASGGLVGRLMRNRKWLWVMTKKKFFSRLFAEKLI